jgi:hypothetical protein
VTEFELLAHVGSPGRKKDNMGRKLKTSAKDEMRAEYDLSGGVRGKYYERYRRGTNVVLLDADVAKVFRDSESVNEALRSLIKGNKNEVTSP